MWLHDILTKTGSQDAEGGVRPTGEQLAHLALAYLRLPEQLSHYMRLITPDFLAETARYEFDKEVVSRPDLGVGGAFSFYGVRMAPDQLQAYIQSILGPDIADLKAGGFAETFVLTGEFSDEQWLLIEQLIARDLVAESLKVFGQSQPDFLFTAASIPIGPDFQYALARAIGMKRPDAVGPVYSRACNSAGSAMFELLSGDHDVEILQAYPELSDPASEPILTTFLIIEDGWRLKNRGGDASSHFFSTGAAAITIKYHPNCPAKNSFVLLSGTQLAVAKDANCLRYLDSTAGWSQRAKSRIRKAPHMTEPDDGHAIQMNLLKTVGFFLPNSVSMLEEQAEKLLDWVKTLDGDQKHKWYKMLFPDQESDQAIAAEYFAEVATEERAAELISAVAMHHPSPGMVEYLHQAVVGTNKKRPTRLRYKKEQFPWLLNSGNAPAVMMVAALILILRNPELETNQILQTLSYGAGGSFTTQLLLPGKIVAALDLRPEQLQRTTSQKV